MGSLGLMAGLVWVMFFPTLALGLWKNSALWLLGENAHPLMQWGAIPALRAISQVEQPMGLQLYGKGGKGKGDVSHIFI